MKTTSANMKRFFNFKTIQSWLYLFEVRFINVFCIYFIYIHFKDELTDIFHLSVVSFTFGAHNQVISLLYVFSFFFIHLHSYDILSSLHSLLIFALFSWTALPSFVIWWPEKFCPSFWCTPFPQHMRKPSLCLCSYDICYLSLVRF